MVKMEISNEEILQKFPSKLQRIIKQLWLDDSIGVSCLNPKIIKLDNHDPPKRVRFLLEVPYAGKQINWEVIFDDDDLNFAPDFHFNDHFLANPDIDVIEKDIPSLSAWNLDDDNSLVNVIKELLMLYKKYQLERLHESKKFQQQQTEYKLLTGEAGVDSEQIEVFIDSQDSVHFLIGIEIDTQEFPPYLQPIQELELMNPGEDAATLKVSFLNNRVSTWLQLSPRLESVIGFANQLQIPAYNKDSGLIEYVPAIVDLIKGKLQQVTRNFKLRSEYVSTLLAYQGHSIVEYDSSMFLKVTLLLEVDDAHTLVFIKLSKHFPQEAPSIQLASVYYENNGAPVMKEYNRYPYDPNLCPETMVQKMLKFVKSTISTFKNACKPLSTSCSQ